MVCCAAKLLRETLGEIFLYSFYGSSVRKSDTSGHSEYMRVDSDHRFAVDDGCDNVGRLSADSRELLEFGRLGRDNAVEIGNEH